MTEQIRSAGLGISASEGDSWSSLEEITAHDESRAESIASEDYSAYLIATDFGFTLPAGSTVLGIKAEIERSADLEALCQDREIRIVKTGSIKTVVNNASVGAAWPLTEAYASYGSLTDVWGETWEVEDINSAGFGLAIRTTFSEHGVTALINHIRITVFYQEPPSLSELAAYLGRAEDSLPSDALRLIGQATDLIKELVDQNYDLDNSEHVAGVKKAICAQVEYWFATGERKDITGPVQEYSASRIRISHGAGEGRVSPTYLAPRAQRYLSQLGLLYQGRGSQ